MLQQRCSPASKCSRYMEPGNLTSVSEFFLLGLSDDPELQPVLFTLFLSMYLVTMLGNLLIILAVTSDPHFHNPMYFFLSNLSLADIGFISTTVPKMIMNIQTHSRVISYEACLTQMSIFIIFGCMDDMLLTVMAYDRYVAICHPLHYKVIMNPHLCCIFISVSFFLSLLDSQVQNLIVLQFTCFRDVEISNFYCDPSLLLNLACSGSFTNNIVMYFVVAIFGLLPFLVIFFSYYKILSSILRVPSSGGMYKAFSTCGPHLSVVCLFYGTALGVYLSSAVSQSLKKDVVPSVMCTVVTPMLNPFIYSLRNRDIKRAVWRLLSKTISPLYLYHPFGVNLHHKVQPESVVVPALRREPETSAYTKQERSSESVVLGHAPAEMQPSPQQMGLCKLPLNHCNHYESGDEDEDEDEEDDMNHNIM
ncbi:olfactory receptor 18-like [Hippopotamus amphibius kiboko]|uniref:olfactory receptor 18-like n=1 Tax=Hippopotamus amphibius kiboko TaxID=575201 RepID=UPI0025970006|nr:olfactory receptor 18-like [Hippopotamus amphibius kiboko]